MTKPNPLHIVAAGIPEQLKSFPQWVLWCYQLQGSRWTKPPFRINGKTADKTNPSHWADFSEVMAAYEEGGYDGIGYCTTAQDPFVFIDLDHCVGSRGASKEAMEIVHKLQTYTEISPSGEGLRIIAAGKIPRNLKQKNIEIYDHAWYLTITGHRLTHVDQVNYCQQQIDQVFSRAAMTATLNNLDKAGMATVERIRASKQAQLFANLMQGNMNGYASQSEADLALCSILAFWTNNDPQQMDAIFRASCLFRQKWDTRHGQLTYGQATIKKALSYNAPPEQEPTPRYTVTNIGNLYGQAGETRMETGQNRPMVPSPVVITAGNLLSREFPPRNNLLSPWLPEQGLCLLHAYRGVGKTHISLGIGCAVATGSSFLNWKADKPRGVLFIDGEMPAVTIKERIAGTMANMDKSLADNLQIITPGLQQGSIPDLGSPEGQAQVDTILTEDISLIILDNISTVCRSTSENKSDAWLPVQEWALRMRAMGKSVLLVHHDGKGGMQRGSSRKEDVLDTVIQLMRPKSYTPDQGALFEVHFRKNRGLHGDDVKPFEAGLIAGEDGFTWQLRTIEESLQDKVGKLLDEGYSQKDIAEELEISKGYCSKLAKQIRAEA